MAEKQPIQYSDVVNYDLMDPFKIACQKAAQTTAIQLNRFEEHGLIVTENRESRGESAYDINIQTLKPVNFQISHVEEGLGTKNIIAHQLRELDQKRIVAQELKDVYAKSFYQEVGIDNAAMILNDLATRGASPVSFMLHIAASDSGWFTDEERNQDLIDGTLKACFQTRCSWGGGETPALRDIIEDNAALLSGSAIGLRFPYQGRYISESNLKEGLRIILLNSSGPHANGITLLRKGMLEMVCDKMGLDYSNPNQRLDSYTCDIGNGQTYGEAIVEPTKLYSRVMDALVVDGHVNSFVQANPPLVEYATHISGHGWRKLMRAKKDFTYVIDKIPEPQPIFKFIKEVSGMSNEKIYGDYNMGAGFALFVKLEHVYNVRRIAISNGFTPTNAGYIEKGPKRVVINPIGVEYKGESLQIR